MGTSWSNDVETTLEQGCIDVTDVDTILFRRRLTMTCLLGTCWWNKTPKYTFSKVDFEPKYQLPVNATNFECFNRICTGIFKPAADRGGAERAPPRYFGE